MTSIYSSLREDAEPYLRCAFTAGELGTNGNGTMGADYQGVAMTLIDSMSTLAVLGNASEFQKQVHWLTQHVSRACLPSMVAAVNATVMGHPLCSLP